MGFFTEILDVLSTHWAFFKSKKNRQNLALLSRKGLTQKMHYMSRI